MATTTFITTTLQKMWNVWNIRGFMIMSLTVQLVLALASPLRQKTSNFIVISIVWSAYFLADWTAIFAFGLISNAGCNKSPSYVELSDDLLALWASFLLIHLGGPDTITAFSLEDNALWLRHLVGLVAQVFAFLYIFVKTLPNNKLMGPVLLVFATGVIKYGERTRALYLANLKNFKKSTLKLSNQGDGMDLASAGDFCVNYKEKVRLGFHFLHIFKGLIVDILPNHSQRTESREFFLKQDADSAFELMAFELNLLYEVFYTKIIAVNSLWGVVVRNVAFYMSVAGLVLFCMNEKEGLQSVDIRITYALLAGVIALDLLNDVMLTNSDWSSDYSAYALWQVIGRCLVPSLVSLLMYLVLSISVLLCGFENVVIGLWSKKMGSFNLLSYSFKEGHPGKGGRLGRCVRAVIGFITEKIGLAEAIAEFRYTSKVGMDRRIWKLMFDIVKERASAANEPNEVRAVYEARGELALRDSSDELKRYVNEFEYDQTVLFWHIATEICYNTDRNLDKNNEHVKFSKTFSDYMIYLMVKQPEMMSAVAGTFHSRYHGTCSELKLLEQKVGVETLAELCTKVLEEYGSEPEPRNDDRDVGGSVLTNSCHLANLLARRDRKWELICGVWVELLLHAAGHCRVVSHARLISEGGEFVTFVWLSMAHLGIGPHFPKN